MEVIGDDEVDAPDEFRECPCMPRYGDEFAAMSLSLSSCLRNVESLGNESERIFLMLL